jgi:membrane protease YdiL (CAAX protease family)
MSHQLRIYLLVAFAWAALAGGLLGLIRIDLGSVAGSVLIAVLYMPSPMVAALIAERGLRRDRLGLPRRGVRPALPYVLLPAGAVVGFVLIFLGVVFLGGNVLGIDAVGTLALTPEQVMAAAADLLGQEAVAAAGPPPPAAVLLLAGLWGALIAGWTLNGFFAMGEEYGWRGLMWDELRAQGPVRANLLIGVAWGLWHAPLIVQGYNYPGFPALGVVAMVAFCIGMSFVLTAVREVTGSLLPVAATHGMFNGIAPLLLILAPAAQPILAGPVGLVGAAIFALLGIAAWAGLRRRTLPGRQADDRAVEGPSAGPAPTTSATPRGQHSPHRES